MVFFCQSTISRSTIRAFYVVVFLMCSFGAFASDDEYMKMLEGEAEDSKLDSSGQINNNEQSSNSRDDASAKNWKLEGNLEGEVIPKGLSQEEFASFLKQRFYGTFVFYRKLTSVDKQTVHYHYTKTASANLDSIRQDILGLLKN